MPPSFPPRLPRHASRSERKPSFQKYRAHGDVVVLVIQYSHPPGLIRLQTLNFSSKTPEHGVVMDVLAEVLSLLRTKGRLYGRLEFTAPWGFAFPGDKGICLMVTRGACFLGVDEQALVPLVGGDFVF